MRKLNSKLNRKQQREKLLQKMLFLIRKSPGIRPSKLNRLLKLAHSASFRKTLIKRGLIIKRKKGPAVYYYAQS